MTALTAAAVAAPDDAVRARAQRLDAAFRERSALDLLDAAIRHEFPGRIALVSSFGAESAVLLDLAARIDPGIPVIFLDTGKLFGETLRYRDRLAARLGLTDVRTIKPVTDEVAAADPREVLWMSEPDRCCHVRKVVPLARALAGFDAWISGRKRFQAGQRADLPLVAAEPDGRIKINPLASWTQDDLLAYRKEHDLPEHPLEADGFLSIGCMPCTDRVAPGEDARSGRWRGRDKTECGIHTHLLSALQPVRA